MKKSAVINRKELAVKDWNDPSLLLKVRWSGVNFYEFVLPNGKTVVMDPILTMPKTVTMNSLIPPRIYLPENG